MKTHFYLKKTLTALFLIPFICFSQEKEVSIRIIQDQEITKLTDFQTNITLKKKPFKFQLLLNNV